MKINLKQISVSLLFCFIFFIFISFNIYGLNTHEGWLSSTGISSNDLKSAYEFDDTNSSNAISGRATISLQSLVGVIQKYCANKMVESSESDFMDLNFVPKIVVEPGTTVTQAGGTWTNLAKHWSGLPCPYPKDTDGDGYPDCTCSSSSSGIEFYMTDVDLSFLDWITDEDDYWQIKFILGEDEYIIKTYTRNYRFVSTTHESRSKSQLTSGKKNKRPIMADNMGIVLEAFQDAAIRGILGGSIGTGYNVGTMYSQRQIALTDAMEKQANGTYDFKNSSIFKQAFSYYMSPLFGQMDALEYSYLFVNDSDDLWVELALSKGLFKNGVIEIVKAYTEFKAGLDEEEINDKGLKITSNVNFRDGAKRFSKVGESRNPSSVLSYHMKIAYPYLFTKVGTSYSLDNQNLRIEPDYTYCVYNDRIYNSNFEEITDRGVIGISRNQIFLYYQDQAVTDSSGTSTGDSLVVGVVIIAEFDECVVDTSSNGSANVFYATGRKIGFNNGYSDLLTIDRANPNLMYNTSEGGKKGFLPRNASFLPTEEESAVAENNYTLIGKAAVEGKGTLMKLPEMSLSSIKTITTDITNHAYIDSPQFIKFFIVFDKVENRKAIEDYNSKTGTQLDDAGIESLGLSHWAFLLIRNNMYINDSELLAWLRTDTARSITYVDADTLLAKITGDFVNSLKKLSFEDWSRMQDIRAELNHNKDMWLVRVFNVMSIVMGVFLFIFAVLICMVYWIDIFNTFSRVSLLQFVSMGRLYPVEDKDMIPYIGINGSGVKYVTFKDVLIIAGIFIIMGFFFLNVSTVITFIVKLYNYIMYVLGGL